MCLLLPLAEVLMSSEKIVSSIHHLFDLKIPNMAQELYFLIVKQCGSPCRRVSLFKVVVPPLVRAGYRLNLFFHDN